jgi:hypothetical protein
VKSGYVSREILLTFGAISLLAADATWQGRWSITWRDGQPYSHTF